MPQIVQIGYQADNDSMKVLQNIQADAKQLESLKTAVLESANEWLENVGAPPRDGAKWTNPGTKVKWNVIYVWTPANGPTTAIVKSMALR